RMALSWTEPRFGLSEQDVQITSHGPLRGSSGTASALSEHDVQFPVRAWISTGINLGVIRLASDRVAEILQPLMDLPHDWDSYQGRPLTQEGAELAEKLVVPLVIQGVAAPDFVPTSAGGL